MADYDPTNVFARILRGEIPAHRVHEDDMTVAFMDVMPMADGHTLVVPKNAARNLLDLPPSFVAATFATAQRIARAVQSAFQADGVFLQQANEAAAGQTVFHMHVHLIPRHAGQPLRPHTGEMATPDLLADHARRIKAALDGA